ncbi:hypothetical protein [Kitasatospora sp. NPDC058478]|uniref:hypothetical protein n=1 Tax=unclassified Kitasatospora TaxID=2633591 RepID=UPI00364FFF7C
MHTITADDRTRALTALAEPGNPTAADDYGHGLEDAKAAIREGLTDHPDPEQSLRTWTATLPPWHSHGHQAGYHHIQYEAAQILADDSDTIADFLPTGDERP